MAGCARSRLGFGLLEIMIAIVIFAVLSTYITSELQTQAKLKKIAEVKSTLTILQQGAMQMAKRYEYSNMQMLIGSDPNLDLCFKEAGTNCNCYNSNNAVLPITCGSTSVPIKILMHSGTALSPLQQMQNEALNGKFNLDGSPCSGTLCALKTETILSFTCTNTSCEGANFSVQTYLNSNHLNSEQKTILASVPNLSSNFHYNSMSSVVSGGYRRSISSTCPVGFSVNTQSQKLECFQGFSADEATLDSTFNLVLASSDLDFVPDSTPPPLCPTPATVLTFSTPGSFNWVVPAGVTEAKFQVWGAGGNGGGNETTHSPGGCPEYTSNDGQDSTVSRGGTVILRGGGGKGGNSNYLVGGLGGTAVGGSSQAGSNGLPAHWSWTYKADPLWNACTYGPASSCKKASGGNAGGLSEGGGLGCKWTGYSVTGTWVPASGNGAAPGGGGCGAYFYDYSDNNLQGWGMGGGGGGYVNNTLAVFPGETFNIAVGNHGLIDKYGRGGCTFGGVGRVIITFTDPKTPPVCP